MAHLALLKKKADLSSGNLRELRPWLGMMALLALIGVCVVTGMVGWSAFEGPIKQYPNSTTGIPHFSTSTTSTAHCSIGHLSLQSNFSTPDAPDRVMDWYRAARMAYANQGGNVRAYHVRQTLGPLNLDFQRTPAIYVMGNETQISISTDLELRWCP